MRRKLRLIIIAVVIAACPGCGSRPSAFHSSFSLKEVIERNKAQFGLDCSSGAGTAGSGGGGSIGSIFGSGRSGYHSSKSIDFSCAQQAGANLDPPVLMEALQRDVGEMIHDAGAKIVDQGTTAGIPWSEKYNADSSFYFKYSFANAEGRLKISVTKIGGQYNFMSEAEEQGK